MIERRRFALPVLRMLLIFRIKAVSFIPIGSSINTLEYLLPLLCFDALDAQRLIVITIAIIALALQLGINHWSHLAIIPVIWLRI